jgi:SAM-dependent methyltransferase
MKEKIISAYNKLAYDYEHSVDSNNPYNADYERPAMLQLLPKNLTGRAALDAGCAAGWYSEQLLKFGANVTAVDITPEMVAATKRRVGNRANVLCHDLSQPLPFNEETFDLIISSLTLHYIDEWDQTFEQFYRVLKPFGQILFSVHHPFMDHTLFKTDDYFSHQLLHDVWKKPNSGEVEVHFYRRPLQSIVDTTTNYFVLEKIVEPKPQKSFQQKDPKGYTRLMTNPHFLIIQARKAI